ncbi:hypothetical protein Tco_0072291 [Tanacetum coccineum]
MGGAVAQTRFETASKKSNDLPLLRVNTLGSGEDNMKLKELMALCTKLSEIERNWHNLLLLMKVNAVRRNLLLPVQVNAVEGIIDFLNASSIRYALTVNPTIFTSCIQQFWASVKAKTVNGER